MALLEIDLDTRDLLRALAQRVDAVLGKVKLELIFVDGEYVDGYLHSAAERLAPTDLECRCRRHAWHPDCPRHGALQQRDGPNGPLSRRT